MSCRDLCTRGPAILTVQKRRTFPLASRLPESDTQKLCKQLAQWFQDFKDGLCGKPKRKKKTGNGSIHLTRELFRFDTCEDGVTRLFIGTKRNNIGYLSIKNHGPYGDPKSLYIKKNNGKYTVSFCYEDGVDKAGLGSQADNLEYLRKCDRAFLDRHTVGIDRGVVRPVQAGADVYDLLPAQKKKKLGGSATLNAAKEDFRSRKKAQAGAKRLRTNFLVFIKS